MQHENRGKRPRLSPAWASLLGGLILAMLLCGSAGRVFADQTADQAPTGSLWAVLSAQGREVVAQGQQFASDVRLLYEVTHLAPLASGAAPATVTRVAAPAAAPASCKMISSRGTPVGLRQPKTRS